MLKSIAIIAVCIFGGCYVTNESPSDRHEFAIYLPAKKIAPEQMSGVKLSELELEESPILSVDDIISYTKASHEIEVAASAYKRITQLDVGV